MSAAALALLIAGAVVIRGALNGLGPVDAFRDVFDRSLGGIGIPARISGGGTRTGTVTGGATFPPAVENWRGLVTAHFPPGSVDQALSVMECESEGKPTARNPVSGASGLFQHLPRFWGERSRKAGVPGANIYDPVANVTVAGWLYKQSNTWAHWSCKPKV